MIKALKKKFVRLAMSVVTILLLAFIAAINITNFVSSLNRSRSVLKSVINEYNSHTSSDYENAEKTEEPQKDGTGFSFGGISEDDTKRAGVFRVVLDSYSSPISAETNNIKTVDDFEARLYAINAVDSKKNHGMLDNFIFDISKTEGGSIITFLDVTESNRSVLFILSASLGIGLFCWLAMFLAFNILSEKITGPIADNLEKQKQFISDAGHEIKTPLASIKANAEALELYNGESKWSKNILTQTDKLSSLVKELLELSRTGEAADNLEIKSIDLSELVMKSVDDFSEYAISDGKTISADIQADVKIKSDSKFLIRILEVLLDNAVKYSSEESTVKVMLNKDRHQTVIAVSNRCVNLPECEPEKLFDRFYRTDSSRSTEGFGIGLSSAKAAAETLGGELYCEYTEPDRITFVLRFI